MNCFPCFSSEKSDSEEGEEEQFPVAQPKEVAAPLLPSQCAENTKTAEKREIAAKAFTFREMAMATKNFRQECLIFDDGFGRVFKGTLKSSGEVVAIKQLDRNGIKGSKDFLDEVATLSPLRHQNLANIVGYCADGDQRMLVYEYMPLGSLETHLLARPEDGSVLDWLTRMKIATGAAQGLQYLHEEADPPVIYRDFKSSYILLDEGFKPKLCYFGLAKLGESGNTTNVPSRVMGTYGYSAPEYARTGELTFKSDIYSFGVILLELISGRRAIDPSRPSKEQNLVTWAQPIFRDPRRFPEMADPLLRLNFLEKSLNQAIGVAAMCLQEEPTVRPYITDVIAALSFLDFDADNPPTSSPSSGKASGKESVNNADDGDKLDNESKSSSSNQKEDDNNDYDDDESNSSSDDEEIVCDNDDDKSNSSSDGEETVYNDNDNDKSNGSSNHEEIVDNDNDDDKSHSSSDHEENVYNEDDDKSNSSSDDEEIVNKVNDADKSGSSSHHDEIVNNDNDDADILSDHEDNKNTSETHDEHHARFSDDNGNSNEIHDDISGCSIDDEDTALTIELDDRCSSSDILLGEDYDVDEIQQNIQIKSTNSKKGKVMEISDDESIYSSNSSSSSSSSIDFRLGEKKTTQKAKSTKKSSVGNSSTKKVRTGGGEQN